MLLVDDIRLMLNIDEEKISTETLQKYIDNYVLKIYEYVGGRVDCPKLINSPLFIYPWLIRNSYYSHQNTGWETQKKNSAPLFLMTCHHGALDTMMH